MINKQEALKKIEKLDGLTIKDKDFNFAIEMIPKGEALEIVNQLDEPEKPVVPQFVADFYESIEDDFEDKVYDLCVQFNLDESELNSDVAGWFSHSKNKPIETLVMMHKFGYEVKKEKLYTVKFSNEDFGKIYIGIFKKFNKLGISSLPLNDDEIKSWFTEDELKRFKFWDNPAFEINEVEEVSRLTDGAWNTLAELNGTEVDE